MKPTKLPPGEADGLHPTVGDMIVGQHGKQPNRPRLDATGMINWQSTSSARDICPGCGHQGLYNLGRSRFCPACERSFHKPRGPRKTRPKAKANPTGVFKFMVPVYVSLTDGSIDHVHVDDETSFAVGDCELVEGDPADLEALVKASLDGRDWPSWEFGW